MEIAVISDLHLGKADSGDRFGHDDGSFLRFLDHLERNFERIVLLGDIWETLGCRRLGDYVAELRRAQDAHPEIARRFERPQYTYIHGNHDLVAQRALGVPSELTLETDGVRLLFTHGHHHDWIIRRFNWLAELGSWVGGLLLCLGQEALFHVLDRWYSGGSEPDPRRCTFRRWALDLAGARSADVVVTAHTHAPACEMHGPKLFMNSGTCAYGRTSFLRIDTRAHDYALHRDGHVSRTETASHRHSTPPAEAASGSDTPTLHLPEAPSGPEGIRVQAASRSVAPSLHLPGTPGWAHAVSGGPGSRKLSA